MPRPVKCRRIEGEPEVRYFKPQGVPLVELQDVRLALDEFEAVRLSDLEGMQQEDAAARMQISRQTFGNILTSARRKIADALVNGKALRIEGGVIRMKQREFVCQDCRNDWSVPHGTGGPGRCPKCGGLNLLRAAHDRGCARGTRGGGFGRRRSLGLCLRRSL